MSRRGLLYWKGALIEINLYLIRVCFRAIFYFSMLMFKTVQKFHLTRSTLDKVMFTILCLFIRTTGFCTIVSISDIAPNCGFLLYELAWRALGSHAPSHSSFYLPETEPKAKLNSPHISMVSHLVFFIKGSVPS